MTTPAIQNIHIGTRASDLALMQANSVKALLLKYYPDVSVTIVPISTTGDRLSQTQLHQMPGKGVFTREIEQQLLDGFIDLAVHSLKDLPTELPKGLAIAAVPPREDPADCLITRDGCTLETLPERAVVLCGSVRRSCQLLHFRPDLELRPVRGNIPTRLSKFRESSASGMILAVAGLRRLNLERHITQRLAPERFLPTPGQGALALEIRDDHLALAKILQAIHSPYDALAVQAERRVLYLFGGGCHTPIGAWATVHEKHLRLHAMIASPDGKTRLTGYVQGTLNARQAARQVYNDLMRQGAQTLLDCASC